MVGESEGLGELSELVPVCPLQILKSLFLWEAVDIPFELRLCLLCLFLGQQPQEGQGLLVHEVSRSNTTTHHCRCTVRRAGPVVLYTHTHHWFKITLPNTVQAHDKHLWTTTNIFSQVQLYTPWSWIAYDPKHVGVIFNFVSFRLLYNVDFNL